MRAHHASKTRCLPRIAMGTHSNTRQNVPDPPCTLYNHLGPSSCTSALRTIPPSAKWDCRGRRIGIYIPPISAKTWFPVITIFTSGAFNPTKPNLVWPENANFHSPPLVKASSRNGAREPWGLDTPVSPLVGVQLVDTPTATHRIA